MDWAVGDRVARDDRVGTVVERYPGVPSSTGVPLWLYTVRWDDGAVERGYFANGLTRYGIVNA